MKDDKKKLVVLVGIGVVLLGLGAWQFSSSGSSAPAAPAKKAAHRTFDDKSKDGPTNPMFANNLPNRDPFAVPETPELADPTKPATAIQTNTTPPAQSKTFDKLRGKIASLPLPDGRPFAVNPVVAIEPQFGYRLIGVIVGARPAAVMQDGQGHQRLVTLGGSLDGDARLVRISRDQVSVLFRGKVLRIEMGGNPVGK